MTSCETSKIQLDKMHKTEIESTELNNKYIKLVIVFLKAIQILLQKSDVFHLCVTDKYTSQ